MHEKTGQKSVILVDEYDKPILDVIDKSKTAVLNREELKNLYSVIKDSDAYIQFAFITGVSKFSRVSLLSGLNNLMDITLDSRFGTVCGYTQNELKTVFADYLTDVPMNKLREWYNGYNFLGEKVYNPFDILLYLDRKEFKNYWFESGTPSFLIKLIENRKYSVPNMECVRLTEASLNSFDVGSIELETLLFQTGYLTIQSTKSMGSTTVYYLKYPNMEVKLSLNDSILRYLTDLNSGKEDNKIRLFEILEGSDIDELRNVFHSFFASIPYEWYTKNTIANYEGYYCSIFYCYFTALGLEVKAEDSTNHGRIDMSVIFRNRCYIFEFKVNELTQEGSALEQLKKRKYHEKYIGYESTHLESGTVEEIYLIGAEFSRTDRNITRFEWERQ